MIIKRFDIGIIEGNHVNPMHVVIHQHTSTWWTHCVIFKDEQGNIWDPRDGGIGHNHISKYKGRKLEILRYKGLLTPILSDLEQWIDKTVKNAKGYDVAAIFGFLTGIAEFQDENKWYCAELPYWLFQHYGPLLTREDMVFVYPSFFHYCNEFELVDLITV